MSSGLSGHLDPVQAARHVSEQCAAGLAGRGGGDAGEGAGSGVRADLALLFFSSHHVEAAKAIVHTVRRRLEPRCLIGVSAESVLGGEVELERAPGVSLLAASLPGVSVHPFTGAGFPADREDVGGLARAAGMEEGLRATVLFADPFSVPINSLLPLLASARPGARQGTGDGRSEPAPIVGGMASASERPGGNVLVVDGEILRSGLVGVSLRGPVRVDAVVSQGCRPFGQPAVITGAKKQIITSLGGRPALRVLHEAIETIPEGERKQLQRGVFIGRAINEYKERFGRDDFLIRNVVGVDQESGAVAVADLVRVGQTVQFHMRDAVTASEDLGLLLDGQKLHDPPAGALLLTCNGRGTRLFDQPHHDAAAVARAFSLRTGEESAKPGTPVPAGRSAIPLAGCFAAGEIGPIGDGVFLHGNTACLALFRQGKREEGD